MIMKKDILRQLNVTSYQFRKIHAAKLAAWIGWDISKLKMQRGFFDVETEKKIIEYCKNQS